MTDVPLRDYIDVRFASLEGDLMSLNTLMRREFDLLSEDRERQRHDLAERLEGMNMIRAQLDRQASTFATREKVEGLEKSTWRALGILGGLVLLVQVVGTVIIKLL